MNLGKTCRTCLQQIIQEKVPISPSLYDFLEQMTINRVPRLHPSLELPQNVCFDCYRNLISFKRFHTQCRDAEEFLLLKLEDVCNSKQLDEKRNGEESENGQTEVYADSNFEEAVMNFEVLNEAEYSETENCDNLTIFQLDANVIQYQRDDERTASDEECQGYTYDSVTVADLDEAEKTANSKTQLELQNFGNYEYQQNNEIKHEINEQPEDRRKRRHFQCNVCAKRFSSKHDLQTHEYIHSGIKPFSCDVCGKSFRQKNVLRTHQTLHFGKTIKCEVCGKTFARKSQLILHDRMHRNLKPFKCDYDDMCGAEFRERQHLMAHQKIHIGVREHQCELCPSAFYHRKGLLSHIRDVHGSICYQCNFCPRTFNKPYKLRKHLQSLHDLRLTDVSVFKTTITGNDPNSEEIDDII